LVFATARHADIYQKLTVPEYFCLVGREAKRLIEKVRLPFEGRCILPPYPRKLGTDVPNFAVDKTFELSKINFTTHYLDSCTTLAIQTAINLSSKNIYIVGYDGYPSNVLSEKEVALTNENKSLFEDFTTYTGCRLVSLTQSIYEELDVKSIYQYI
jgi:4-hydroxy 2-oxovalerate aldolase